jgi:large subunit ribosomal protein L19
MSQATGKVALVEKKYQRLGLLQDVTPGDTVKVHVKIREGEKERIQIYEGTVIGLQGTGARKSVVVRKISYGVGVERVFPVASPAVAKIERTMQGRVRRAKIYYVRKLQGKAAAIANEANHA